MVGSLRSTLQSYYVSVMERIKAELKLLVVPKNLVTEEEFMCMLPLSYLSFMAAALKYYFQPGGRMLGPREAKHEVSCVSQAAAENVVLPH